MALALGLTIGLGLIYMLDILDDRFRSPEDLRAQLGVPVLAMVRQMEDLHAVGLGELQMLHRARCGRQRNLPHAADHAGLFRRTKRPGWRSPAEPGDGKTTVLANLAVSLCPGGQEDAADRRRHAPPRLDQSCCCSKDSRACPICWRPTSR